ncbi:MAG: acyl-CoA dehydratase activase-related protein [Heliobacteriaceae bacterium]|nr:acyl-CoA dehydratase activase-related protein [Heliobacteriaceae bacterium]
MRVGIPQTLTYFEFYPLYCTFFRELGFEVVTSGETTKPVMDQGILYTVTDSCIPIKLMHGHVAELAKTCDAIFVPRFVRITGEEFETFCPKFLGLPDMLNASIPKLPLLISPKVDLYRWPRLGLLKLAQAVGDQLGKKGLGVYRALVKALRVQTEFRRLVSQGLLPPEAIAVVNKYWQEGDSLVSPVEAEMVRPEAKIRGVEAHPITLGVVGFPYTLYDNFINSSLLNKLCSLGVKTYTPEMVSPAKLAEQAKGLPKPMFWYFSNRVYRAARYLLVNKKIDGLIHVTAFGCGPDAMADKLIELEAKQHGFPFMSLCIDEHTGEAGLNTRLEAFVDMLQLRKGEQSEHNLSAHGQFV